MKRLLCLLVSAALTACLTACGGAPPLKERLIVEGIAVDEAAEGEEEGFALTVQAYAPSSENTTHNRYQLFRATGKTVYEALRTIDQNTGRESFFADTQVILFSAAVLERGLWPNLDFFMRSSEMGNNVCLAMTKGKAADLLTVEGQGDRMPAGVLADMLHYGKSKVERFSGEMMTVGARLTVPYADLTLPLLAVERQGEGRRAVLAGVTCFIDDRPAFVLNGQMTWAYNWIRGYADERAFVLPFRGELCALRFQRIQAAIESAVEEGRPRFTLRLKAGCNVSETAAFQAVTLENLPEFETALAKKMEQTVEQTLQTVFLQQHCDVFDLGRSLIQQHPAYFQTLSSWRQTIPLCTVQCEAEVSVKRAGQLDVNRR